MTPRYEISANGKPITSLISPILNSLTVTDETGEQSDRLSIALDDSTGTLELPKRGAVLTLKLGFDTLVYFGQFTVDTVSGGGPPSILRIEAHAVPMAGAGKMQERKSRSWDSSLGDIVKKIAGENGLDPVIASELQGIDFGHLDQTDESDASFLARLARDCSGAIKVTAGRLAMILRGSARTASGAAMGGVSLHRADLSSWSYTFADRGGYKTAIASYRDTVKAQTVDLVVGKGEPVFRLPHIYSSAGNARRAAQSRLDDFKRSTGGMIQLSMPARLDIIAETPVSIFGIRQGVDGRYIARRVEHTLSGGSGGGLRTTVDCEGDSLSFPESSRLPE